MGLLIRSTICWQWSAVERLFLARSSLPEFFQVQTTDKIFEKFGDDQDKWAQQYKVEPITTYVIAQ